MIFSPEYLAGVMDSNGSFSITKRHISRKNPNYIGMIQITWTHTKVSEAFMQELKNIYGGSYFIGKCGTFKNSKPIVKYCAVGAAAETLTRSVIDFLILKKEQANNVLKLREITKSRQLGKVRSLENSEKLERLYLLNKQLNYKNKGDDYVFST